MLGCDARARTYRRHAHINIQTHPHAYTHKHHTHSSLAFWLCGWSIINTKTNTKLKEIFKEKGIKFAQIIGIGITIQKEGKWKIN